MTDNYTVSIDCYSMNLQLSIVKSDKQVGRSNKQFHSSATDVRCCCGKSVYTFGLRIRIAKSFRILNAYN